MISIIFEKFDILGKDLGEHVITRTVDISSVKNPSRFDQWKFYSNLDDGFVRFLFFEDFISFIFLMLLTTCYAFFFGILLIWPTLSPSHIINLLDLEIQLISFNPNIVGFWIMIFLFLTKIMFPSAIIALSGLYFVYFITNITQSFEFTWYWVFSISHLSSLVISVDSLPCIRYKANKPFGVNSRYKKDVQYVIFS